MVALLLAAFALAAGGLAALIGWRLARELAAATLPAAPGQELGGPELERGSHGADAALELVSTLLRRARDAAG